MLINRVINGTSKIFSGKVIRITLTLCDSGVSHCTLYTKAYHRNRIMFGMHILWVNFGFGYLFFIFRWVKMVRRGYNKKNRKGFIFTHMNFSVNIKALFIRQTFYFLSESPLVSWTKKSKYKHFSVPVFLSQKPKNFNF